MLRRLLLAFFFAFAFTIGYINIAERLSLLFFHTRSRSMCLFLHLLFCSLIITHISLCESNEWKVLDAGHDFFVQPVSCILTARSCAQEHLSL